MDRSLDIAVKGLAAGRVTTAVTKGAWIALMGEGKAKVDAATRDGLALNATFDLENTSSAPPPLGANPSDTQKAEHNEALMLLWGNDTKWVRLSTWGDLTDPETGCCPLGGWLAYAVEGVGAAPMQGRSGPLGKVVQRIMTDLKPLGSEKVGVGMHEDVTTAVLEVIRRGFQAAPREYAVIRPAGAQRPQALMSELRCADPQSRAKWEAALFDERA